MSQNVAVANRGAVAAHRAAEKSSKASFWALALGSIGVVYGDIGTSPLYALREAVSPRPSLVTRQVSRWCLASCR